MNRQPNLNSLPDTRYAYETLKKQNDALMRAFNDFTNTVINLQDNNHLKDSSGVLDGAITEAIDAISKAQRGEA